MNQRPEPPTDAPWRVGDIVMWKLAPRGARAGKVVTCEWKLIAKGFLPSPRRDDVWRWWCRVEWNGRQEHIRSDELRRPDIVEALAGLG